MSRIKSKETRLEINFRKLLYSKGFRYRKNYKNLYGKPDVAFNSKKIVIFIDSCFWHGCKKHLRLPATNVDYWKNKIKRNQKRDEEVSRVYKKMGWTALRLWEHELVDPIRSLNKVTKFLI